MPAHVRRRAHSMADHALLDAAELARIGPEPEIKTKYGYALEINPGFTPDEYVEVEESLTADYIAYKRTQTAARLAWKKRLERAVDRAKQRPAPSAAKRVAVEAPKQTDVLELIVDRLEEMSRVNVGMLELIMRLRGEKKVD